LGAIPEEEERKSKEKIKYKRRREETGMTRVERFLLIFILTFTNLYTVNAQKIIENIKSEKHFRKLTNYKDDLVWNTLAWTPDGSSIIYARRNGEVRKYDLRTGKDKVLTSFSPYEVKEIRFSATGNRIAYLIEKEIGETMIILEDFNAKEGKKNVNVIRMPYYQDIWNFILTPDEKRIIYPFLYGNEYYGIGEVNIEKRRFRVIKKFPEDLDYLNIAFNYKDKDFYVLLEKNYEKKRFRFLLFGLAQHNLKKSIKIDLNLEISQVCDVDCEGKRILFIAYFFGPLLQKYGNIRGIFEYNIKEFLVNLLTKEKENVHLGEARYSPDCKKIAFLSDRNGFWNLWLLDLEEKK
jgi:hypothetical protein